MSERGNFGYEGYGSYTSGGPVRDSTNEFTRLTQSIGNNITKINQNVTQLQRMVNQIGTPQDTPELRDKLHENQHYTNQVAKDTNKYMKDISALPNPPSASDQRQWKMQKERLMNNFSQALEKFQAAQRQAAQKEKESVAKARANSTSAYDPFRDDPKDTNLVDLGSPVGNNQMQNVAMEEDVDIQLLQEREQALRQLESDITDVNQIFKDLGVLVHEQGEMIDSIEANVENAAVHVEEGTTELSKAREYQSKARKKKCIIVLILLVVLGILATILGVTLSGN